MASIGDIKIRLGIDTKPLEKSLRKAEFKLKRFSRITGEIGGNLLKNVTLPIVGMGVAAIKTAGDFEQLTNGLTSIMGSSELAAAEIEKLRKEALKPGLDLTQAVKGSVRLQSVGIDAELARKALSNFGNAIALAGGTSSDLDGVTLALTQIVSKGKISAEEINQLAERVPQVRAAIESAFGTGDSEALQKLGISAEEFVTKVTDEMGKLPQAVGGINNSINNAGQAVAQFLVTIGNDIEKSFNVSGKVAEFADWLNDLAGRFARLEDGTKAMIVKTLAFAAAVGPAIKVLSIFTQTIGTGISMARLFITNLRGMGETIIGVAKKFAAMDKAMKLTTIGLVVAAVATAVVVFNELTKSIDAVAEVTKEGEKQAAGQIATVKSLTGVIESQTTSIGQKEKALNMLKGISDDYYGDLEISEGKVKGLTEATDAYTTSLIRQATAAAAASKIQELAAKKIELSQQKTKIEGAVDYTGLKKGTIARLGDEIAELDEEMKALSEIRFNNLDDDFEAAAESANKVASATEKIFKRKDNKKDEGEAPIARIPEEGTNQLERIAVNFQEITLHSNNAAAAIDNFAARGGVLTTVKTRADEIKAIFQNMNAELTSIINSGINSAFVSLGESIGGALVNAKSFGQAIAGIGGSMLNTLASMLGEVGKMAIQTGLAIAGIKAALKSLNPAVAIAAGIALVALSKAVPAMLAKKVPAFAKGVENFGGGMALVGEAGPELVNLPRGSDVIPNHTAFGGGVQEVRVTGAFKMRGNDLYVVLQQEAQKRGRIGL